MICRILLYIFSRLYKFVLTGVPLLLFSVGGRLCKDLRLCNAHVINSFSGGDYFILLYVFVKI